MTAPPGKTSPPLPSLTGAPWLTRAPVAHVFQALEAGGLQARAVGGAVRNALLGLPAADVDIATPALPEDVMRVARAAGLKAVPTGIEHGTVTLIADGEPVEVTTLRRDVETDGRRAVVAFTTDWAEDAGRRDFTINALYCDSDGTIHDPLGGYDDLVSRRVRFIGDARERIREDYLRILRFFRFTATYAAGAPDAVGLAAVTSERAGLARLSGERAGGELLRLLGAPRAVEAVAWMADAGILDLVLGKKGNTTRMARLAAIEAATGRPADAVLRLAALAVERSVEASDLQLRLRLSNADAERIAVSAGLDPSHAGEISDLDVARALYRFPRAAAIDRWLIAWAASEHRTGDAAMRAGLARLTEAAIPVLPVRGADVLARGIPAGKRVGEIVAAFEAWWLDAGMPDDEARAARKLDELVATSGGLGRP